MRGDDLPRTREHLTRQLERIVDANTTWVDIGEQLDVSQLRDRDGYPSWHRSSKDFDAVFKAVLWAEVENESHTGIRDRLEANPEIAEAFGFDVEDLPHGDTFRLAYTKRFEDLHTKFEIVSANLNALAQQRGAPIGAGGVKVLNTDGASKRTEQRLLRYHARKVMDEELPKLVFPELRLPRPDKAIYTEEDLKRVITKMSLANAAANDTGLREGDDSFFQHFAEDEDPSDYTNAPFYADGPTGETVLDSIHELTPHEIADMVNDAAGNIFTRIKPYAEFKTPVFLAIDITYVGYWGDTDGLVWITGAPDDKEYRWCYKFATATVVGENVHQVVAMLPIGNAEIRDPDAYAGTAAKSYRIGEVVRDLLDIACEFVPIKQVFADREFAAADVIKTLDERGLYYMIPAPRNKRLKRWLNRNMEDGIVSVEKTWRFFGPTKNATRTREYVETTLIGVPNDPDMDQYPWENIGRDDMPSFAAEADAVPFFTNKPVSDEIALERRSTLREVKKYSKRGGIETSYRKIKGFMPSTTSKDFSVRLFHFGFAVLMYNLWLMVDFLVQVGMDIEVRYKPRISAKRFKNYVERWVGVPIF